MAEIKDVVRLNPAFGPRVAADALRTHLLANHSQERLAALRVCDVLFRRSKAFRQALAIRCTAAFPFLRPICNLTAPLPPRKKWIYP
jgi:hypothetical protein